MKPISPGPLFDRIVSSWNDLGPRSVPDTIRLLHEHGSETAVFRLEGMASVPGSVIAKRSFRGMARTECEMYRQVLTRIPVPTPEFFGCHDSDADGAVWVFTGEVSGVEFDRKNQRHRAAAARWVGSFHVATAGEGLPDWASDRGLSHMQGLHRAGVENIDGALSSGTLNGEQEAVLQSLLASMGRIGAAWGDLERRGRQLPASLVHGDFVAKNLIVTEAGGQTEIVPCDWESAGRGFPSSDLGEVDLEEYFNTVEPHWPDVDRSLMAGTETMAKLYRLLHLVFWGSQRLQDADAERVMERQMTYYRDWMADVVERLDG